ncbi:Uncharacterised protein [Mycobacteroides abscessus subsp. abscessus]|nr:Uncharacterised protein [Mycobacteroides abscessus subsp. abscessus]
MPASISPVRVPITNPSSGVRPIEVSTARPRRIADADAPLPRCSTIWLMSAYPRPRKAAACCDTYWCEVP